MFLGKISHPDSSVEGSQPSVSSEIRSIRLCLPRANAFLAMLCRQDGPHLAMENFSE